MEYATMKGHWKGFYKYKDEYMQELIGHEKTFFDLHITAQIENTFSGEIEDDATTGGMPGIGKVHGEIIDDTISFEKEMPICAVIWWKKIKLYKKKHPKIYYKGTLEDDGNTIRGEWRFKFGITFIGIFPVPVFPIKGTFEMQKME